METSIKINPEITVQLPPDKIIIDRYEYEKLKRETDYRRWWGMDQLRERYGHDKEWFKKMVFSPYERQLRDRIVMYPYGGRSGYWCEPEAFSNFIRTHFPEICKRAAR